MEGPGFGMHAFSAAELKRQFELDKQGVPYLVLRDGAGELVLLALAGNRERLTIGRALACDVALPWDEQVSRVHAELQLMGGEWAVSDDGLSRNGTFVGGERLRGRRVLADGDVVRTGSTSILYRAPLHSSAATAPSGGGEITVTEAQRRVLVALCRPFRDGGAGTVPPSNQEIAAELFLSVEAVKTHLRTLFEKLGVEDLPANQKRGRLVELAFEHGVVKPAEL